MRFDREDSTDRAVKNLAKQQAKNFAKKQAKKAMGKHGKQAAKAAEKLAKEAAKKIAVMISSSLGTPAVLTAIVAIVVLLCLPSTIFSSMFGAEAKYNPTELTEKIGTLWEDDAEAAIEERFKDLKNAVFWTDLGTFFSTGTWGEEGTMFKTEFASAEDADNAEMNDYFSASNRLIAIINEAFRLSMTRSRISQEGQAAAEQAIEGIENELRSSAIYGKPDYVEEQDYEIIVDAGIDPNFSDDQNFLYESCYLLAAGSGAVNDSESYAQSVRNILDYVFAVTGLDGNTDKNICWEVTLRSEYETIIDSYRIEIQEQEQEVKTTVYAARSDEDKTVYYDSMEEIPENYEFLREEIRTTIEIVEVEVIKYTRTVKAHSYYSIVLSPNYRDIIIEHCGTQLELPEDAKDYEISDKQAAETSALELFKLYMNSSGAYVDMGDAGMPLTAGSYYISSEYGWRTLNGAQDFHLGVDLAAPAGTPIYAVKDGVCDVPGYDSSYGNYVTIDHGGGVTTRYAHMIAVAVSNGESVVAGQIIGYVGSTGNSTGDHLHFEVRLNNATTDPLGYEFGDKIREGSIQNM